MKYDNLTIKEIHNLLVDKKITVQELVQDTLDAIKTELKSNTIITLLEEQATKIALDFKVDPNKVLSGIPYLLKDNIWVKGTKTTAGSNMLKNFNSPDDATITELLNEQGAILIGKAAMDELAMGGTGLESNIGPIHNPLNKKHIIGGSSSGSAYAVAKGWVPYAIGTDTGDSIRKPASYVGIVGFKPTYGAISRYGVIPYAPSMDHLGFFTRNVEDQFYLCHQAFKKDTKDATSIEVKMDLEAIDKLPNIKTIGYFANGIKWLNDGLKMKYFRLFDEFRQDGHIIEAVDINDDLLKAISELYIVLSYSEAVSVFNSLNGVSYGSRTNAKNFEQMLRKTRSENLGWMVKKRFVIGNYALQPEQQESLLNKAHKIRYLICAALKSVFEQVDILLLPPAVDHAPSIIDVNKNRTEDLEIDPNSYVDDLLILANFYGNPSITIPFVHKNGLPIGISLNADKSKDQDLLIFAKYAESVINKMDNKEVDNE